jgi:hypothetical protein
VTLATLAGVVLFMKREGQAQQDKAAAQRDMVAKEAEAEGHGIARAQP